MGRGRTQSAGEGVSGYSCSGVVLEVGAAVRGLSVGDRVACGGAGHANHAEALDSTATKLGRFAGRAFAELKKRAKDRES